MYIHTLIADDHPALVNAIAHTLSGHASLKVGTIPDSNQIIERLSTERCDVVVTDPLTSGNDASGATARLSLLRRRHPDLKIIVFTTIDNPALITQILQTGVNAVLNKMEDIDLLASSVHAVHAGATYLSPKARYCSHELTSSLFACPFSQQLTRRETEVIGLYAHGLSVGSIARQLKRTKQTVSAQKNSAMLKLGITQDIQLYQIADQHGLPFTQQPYPVEQLRPAGSGRPGKTLFTSS
ncbi:response regulator [Pseudomonas mosselii]|uniref:response regulator n=1 Tax=Pseudomonas mosselii TaxID=78327 RepID=UPI003F2C5D79